jgi:hypothetical protein
MTEWVNDSTEPPTVLIAHRGRFVGTGAYCSVQDSLGIIDHE